MQKIVHDGQKRYIEANLPEIEDHLARLEHDIRVSYEQRMIGRSPIARLRLRVAMHFELSTARSESFGDGNLYARH